MIWWGGLPSRELHNSMQTNLVANQPNLSAALQMLCECELPKGGTGHCTCARASGRQSQHTTNLSRKGFCRDPGIFRRHLRVNSVGFLVDFLLEPSSLEKTGANIHPKIHSKNSNQNLGVSGPKSTLQGSGLDNVTSDCESFGILNTCR